ncbi:MAG: hypothetical protein APU95_00395 [Hadesarchaea archaeon YNP_N21]|nr:MAG: hypothetical protein APU95_00395 [Hadesarchaea archaeon YNP_N21]
MISSIYSIFNNILHIEYFDKLYKFFLLYLLKKEVRKMRTKILAGVVVLAAAVLLAGYFLSYSAPKQVEPEEPVVLNGAGASFPYPLIDKWTHEYKLIAPKVTINYQSIGSGGGIKAIADKTVDFAASDAPLTDDKFRELAGILHIPETMGAVAVVYNIPGAQSMMRLTGEILSEIYLGKITRWNDKKIVSLNPWAQSLDKEILVVRRSDGSGTTFIFTDYLSRVSSEWANTVGKGTSVSWPVGVGAKGNEGVAGAVKQNQFSIGYVELAYAIKENLSVAAIQNREGKFVEPTLDSIKAAAASASPKLPKGDQSWADVSIVSPPGADSYPIASFTYILVYKDQPNKAKGEALAKFLWWVVHDGQKYSSDLAYAPLPSEVVKLNEQTLKLLNYNGEPFIK